MYIHPMKYVNFLFIALFLLSCNSNGEDALQHNGSNAFKHSILNLAKIYGESERNISFPNYFNDSIVKQFDIKSIERRFYFSSADTFLRNEGELGSDKSFLFEFDKNGWIKNLTVKNHYDYKAISGIVILYKDYQPQSGYAVSTIEEKSQLDDFHFNRYTVEKTTKNLYTYKNVIVGSNLFVVPNPKHWKPLVIDTMCRPKKEDFIVWGSMKKPMKIYQVNNLVEESNVREFNYENGCLKSIKWTDDPFQIVRRFQYNANGICDKFIDSTFSMGGFVSTSRFDIHLDGELPKEIVKTLTSSSGDRIVFKENFFYSYFSEKK